MKFNKLIPELKVSSIKRSLQFYLQILGFKVEYERAEEKFAFLSYEGSQLMLAQELNAKWKTGRLEYPFGRGVNFEISVKSINPILSRL